MTAAAATAAEAATTSPEVSPPERAAPASAGAVSFVREREQSEPMAGGRRRILLVEDELSITEPLAAALEREGFDAHVAGTVAEALAAAEREQPDLVLLDVMLPDGSGFDVCRELRRHSRVPIIMLTARGEEADRVIGLELGADDYVVKPFSAREVVARVRAVLRRAEPAPRDLAPTVARKRATTRHVTTGATTTVDERHGGTTMTTDDHSGRGGSGSGSGTSGHGGGGGDD
jgi:CheY-like chemotaxis protein